MHAFHHDGKIFREQKIDIADVDRLAMSSHIGDIQ